MDRVIKFRAWDGLNKKWLMGYEYKNLGGFSLTGESVLFGEWGNCFDQFLFNNDGKRQEHLIIDQFTGLKDKNGKDIYEGDIFKHNLNNKRWIVSNDGLGFTISNTKSPKYPQEIMYLGEALHIWKDHKIELTVLGNIHENPDLCSQS